VSQPIGYLVTTALAAGVTAVIIAPLRRPRVAGRPSWAIGLVPNELPFHLFRWPVVSPRGTSARPGAGWEPAWRRDALGAVANRDAPPFFVAHGELDTLTPVEGARRLVGRLRSGAARARLPRAGE